MKVKTHLTLLAGVGAVILGCMSCGSSEAPDLRGYEYRGHIEERWAYYPFIEEVIFPEKIIAGEEFEITVHLYFPPDVPEKLYYLPGGGMFAVSGGPGIPYSLAVSDDPGWQGYELVPMPSREEWVFSERFPRDPYFELLGRARTYTLSFLGAASREDAGLIRTVVTNGGRLSPEELEEFDRWHLGDGKLKWFHYEVTVLSAEDTGAHG